MRASAAVLLTLLAGCAGLARTPKAKPAADAKDASASADWRPEWRAIGESVEGRPLRVCQVGHGPRKVLWVGGIHGNEREGRISTQELPRELLRNPQFAAAATLWILEDANPDGTARNIRGNARNIDLNRNYPAANFKPDHRYGKKPLDQPEAKALHDLVLELRPHLVIVAHSWHDDHFINFDGPARELAERFSRLSGYRVKESDSFAPTPGSLGSWVGGTLGIPILTLEHLRGREAWAAWQETRQAILSVIVHG